MNHARIKVTGLLLFPLVFAVAGYGFEQSDSAERSNNPKKYNLKLTARVHSIGMFNYSGRIVNDNPAFDVNFTYQRRSWGMTMIKVVDVYDIHSHNNFALVSIFKNFHTGKQLTITPYVGVAFEQNEKLAGHGSDVLALMITNLSLNNKISLEHTTMFSNMMIEPEYFGWLNRLRLLYKHDHLDVSFSGWHNNKVFDETEYYSAAVYTAYSRIKVSEKVLLSAGLTGLLIIRTSDEQQCPKKNGLMLTIAAMID